MPGKGKMGRKKLNRTSVKCSEDTPEIECLEMVDIRSVHFPHVKIADNLSILPKYSTILKRPQVGGVLMQDLDMLQIELETLLTLVAQRHHNLEQLCQYSTVCEQDNTESDQKSIVDDEAIVCNLNISADCLPLKSSEIDEKSSTSIKESQSTVEFKKPFPVKNKKISRKLTSKKPKEELIKLESESDTSLETFVPKAKPKRFSKVRCTSGRFATYDYSSKYWNSMHNICHDFQEADLRVMRELVKSQEVVDVPLHVGKSFTRCWAECELTDEKLAASTLTVNKRKYSKFNPTSLTVSSMIGKAEEVCKELISLSVTRDSDPLYKRLISSLKQENIITPHKGIGFDVKIEGREDSVPFSSINNMSQFGGTDLVCRIRQELLTLGSITNKIRNKRLNDNDLVEEIDRANAELRAASRKNTEEMMYVLLMSEHEMLRQELNRKLRIIDEEIDKVYRSIMIQKSRNVNHRLCVKVYDQSSKLFKRRELLKGRIESLDKDIIKLKSNQIQLKSPMLLAMHKT